MDFVIYYGLTLVALVITMLAQGYINYAYSKYAKVKNKKNLNGHDAARTILDENGLSNVQIREVSGYLSDHYDPRSKEVRLSSKIYHEGSVASVSVAAHECGHAIQDKEGYFFLRLRASLVPLVNFSSYAGYFAILIGVIAGLTKFITIGIILECVILFFQIVTLPVEFNASSRALKNIKKLNLLNEEEYHGGKTTLIAAALTYVASVLSAIIELLRLILVYGRRDD